VFNILRQHAAGVGLPPTTPDRGNHVDRLAKLADLLDKGLIDRSEFDSLKRDLLGT
jgi:hypothetical protein